MTVKSTSLLSLIFKIILFISLHFYLFSICLSYGQDINYVIKFADKNYKSANYNTAIKEYQRAIYFADSSLLPDLYMQTAHSYYFIQNYSEAIKYYQKALGYLSTDSIILECKFQIISCYIFLEHFRFALQELDKTDFINSEYNIEKRNLFYGICYFGRQEYDLSFGRFLKAVPNNDMSTSQKLNQLFKNSGELYRPSPKFAKFLSIIVPG